MLWEEDRRTAGLGKTERPVGWEGNGEPARSTLPRNSRARTGSLCSLGFDGDKFVAQLFGLPFEFCFQPFLPLDVSGVPDGLVIFDLVLPRNSRARTGSLCSFGFDGDKFVLQLFGLPFD